MYRFRKSKISSFFLTAVMVSALISGCGSRPDAGNTTDTDPEAVSQAEGRTENSTGEDLPVNELSESETEDVSDKAETEAVISEDLTAEVYDTVYPSTAGALQVKDSHLCSESGKPVQLRGVSTHGIQWFPEYINQELFNEFHDDWNVNVVRLAMYTTESEGYCEDGDRDAIKQTMFDGIDYATNADLYAIVDWHCMRDGDPTTYEDDAIDFFEEVSEKYADHDNVIYEICNEPNTVTWAVIREYAMKVIPVIRANDPNAIILVGTPIYCKAPTEPAKDPITEYDNIMYTCHFYAASHHESIQNELRQAIEDGLPIFVSEYGICANTGAGSLDTEWGNSWIDLLNQNGISYVCWQLSNKHESSSLILEDCDKTSGFTLDDLSEHGKWLIETYAR